MSDAELEIETKAGRWKIRETADGGLGLEFESDQPNGGYFEVKHDYDQDACVLIPRKRAPSCSGGG